MPSKDIIHPKRILVIKLRHIGDVLLTVPAIRAARETYPDAYIAVLVNKGTEEVLKGNPLIDEVMTYDRGMKKRSVIRRVKGEIAFVKYLRAHGFDMTIDLTSGDRPAIYSYLSGAVCRIGYNPRGKGFRGKSRFYSHLGSVSGGRLHTVLKELNLVRQFGIDTEDLSVRIFFSEVDRRSAEAILAENGIDRKVSFVHIHPTSRWLFKCWRDDYMAEVIDYLEQTAGVRVVITSGPDEKEVGKIHNIIKNTHSNPVNLAGRLTLKQLAALTDRALMFFGVDTAPMHIAAAVDTPVVALFGPSGAFDWGPWDNGETLNHTQYPEKNGLQVSGMHAVIQSGWDCVPCGRDGCEGSKKSECLEAIKPQDVIKLMRTRYHLN